MDWSVILKALWKHLYATFNNTFAFQASSSNQISSLWTSLWSTISSVTAAVRLNIHFSFYSECVLVWEITAGISGLVLRCFYPLFPVLSAPSWSRQMAALLGSGSDGGFFLLKGSFSLHSRLMQLRTGDWIREKSQSVGFLSEDTFLCWLSMKSPIMTLSSHFVCDSLLFCFLDELRSHLILMKWIDLDLLILLFLLLFRCIGIKFAVNWCYINKLKWRWTWMVKLSGSWSSGSGQLLVRLVSMDSVIFCVNFPSFHAGYFPLLAWCCLSYLRTSLWFWDRNFRNCEMWNWRQDDPSVHTGGCFCHSLNLEQPTQER